MNEINLLPKIRESLIKRQKTVRTLRLISVAFLLATTISSLVLFFLSTSSPISSLKQEENKVLSQLSSHKEKTERMFVIRERLKHISDILDKRGDYETEITLITDKLPPLVTIDSFSVSQNAITIITSSSSLLSLKTFSDNITDIALNKKVFSKVSFDDLVYDGASGKYSLSIKADLL